MKNRWIKLGQLFSPESSIRHHKLASHAANPLPVHLTGDIFRIFYNGRDDFNRSSIGAVDIDIMELSIITDHFDPFFENGPPGSFYSDGLSLGDLYSVDDVSYILFMGWENPPDNHWRGVIGRLTLTKNSFLLLEDSLPLIDLDPIDPYSLSYPCVFSPTVGEYQMFYGSTISWDVGNGDMLHVINRATSLNGKLWIKHGLALPYELGHAQAFSKPSVLQSAHGGYDMWFSYRGAPGCTYRIGFAHSDDMCNWRLDLSSSGIEVSPSGWDSEMICYPFVFRHRESTFMLYNGNGYGLTGFGLALLQTE